MRGVVPALSSVLKLRGLAGLVREILGQITSFTAAELTMTRMDADGTGESRSRCCRTSTSSLRFRDIGDRRRPG
jgi:hypothetical protein